MVHAFWMQLISRYGYAGLFGLLAVGIMGIPVPDEVLLTYAGFLVHKGTLGLWLTLGLAFSGSIFGMTVNYVLGRYAAGALIRRYGQKFGITPEKLKKSHQWFRRFGSWLLVFGYFIPGVRHVAPVVAGTSGLEFGRFAAFSYLGAAAWCIIFVSLGIYVGDQWEDMTARVRTAIIYGAALVGFVVLIIVLARKIARKKAPF